MNNDLLELWIRFCKRCAVGSRLWIQDEDFDRLSMELDRNMRFLHPPAAPYRIDFRGGYMGAGVSFYRKSAYERTKTAT